MRAQRSLRSKSVLFLLAYTVALEGGIVSYFYYSGRTDITRQSASEARTLGRLAGASLERELGGALTEMAVLRSQLQLYGGDAGRRKPSLAPVEEFIVGQPNKYASIGVLDRATRRLAAVRVLREFGRDYPVDEVRYEEDPPADCPPGSGLPPTAAPCVAGLEAGVERQLLTLVVPLTADGGQALVARLYLSHLLDALGRLSLPAGVTLLATNQQGLVLYARDPALLRTYLNGDAGRRGLQFQRDSRLEQGEGRRAEAALAWQRLRALDLVVVVERGDAEEFARLRLRLLKVALFTALLTLAAFGGVWALSGRMSAQLGHVASVATSVAQGDFSRRIDVRRNDELGLLIEQFNSMSEQLERSYRNLQEVNRQLRAKVHALSRARRRLSERQRMALVGEAMAKTSHEIQNRMGAIGVWVQNLKRGAARDERSALCIDELESALAACSEMLAHFKRFYRRPVLHVQPMDGRDLIAACLARMAPVAEARGARLVGECGDEPAWVEVDAPQLSDGLVNILLNALEVSPPGGSVVAGVRLEDDHTVVFRFCDEGPGVRVSGRLFRPFYTTKPQGSGLGLAITRNLVRAHGGRIRALNRPEGGACFEIRLQRVAAPAIGELAARAAGGSLS